MYCSKTYYICFSVSACRMDCIFLCRRRYGVKNSDSYLPPVNRAEINAFLVRPYNTLPFAKLTSIHEMLVI